jgi:plastocyanin
MDALMAKVDATVSAANAMVEQPVQNADGTTTYKVMIGYSDGQIDLMSFFPSKLNVHPGDTVVWTLGPKDVAPHTVTFLNGADEPPLAVPSPQGNGQMLLLFNPAVAVPQNVGQPITKQGIFNSGMMIPEVPPTHTFTAKIGNVSGDLNYLCLLHDSSGMTGTITVTAK